MKKRLLIRRVLTTMLLGLGGVASAGAATVTYTASGSWTAPAGVGAVTVQAWGGGGAGGGQNRNRDAGGGGGGGGYSSAVLTVVPGNTYAVSVGAAGVAVSGATGGNGGDSSFASVATLLAKGGLGGQPSTQSPNAGGVGGAGGQAAQGVGTTKYSGGVGGAGRTNGNGSGGPGGSSAGTAAAGTSGANPWTTVTAAAGPTGSGIGGNGGGPAADGVAPTSGNGGGGGGGGSDNASHFGGNGAVGKVVLTYVEPLTKVASAASATVNDVVTFTIKVNNSTAAAFGATTVTDTLPTGMEYGSHVVNSGSVVVSGQTVTWTLPAVAAGSSESMVLAVSLKQQGTLTNTASVTGWPSASASVLVLATAVTQFRMDEPAGSWTGAVGEVIDSGSTALHGRRVTTSTPTTTNEIAPANTIAAQYGSVVGGFCNAGQFDGNAVVQVASSPLFGYTNKLSASAWVYPTAYNSDLSSILSNDQNYEFHLNSSGKLYWWWNYATLTSATTIPLNQWTHVAITFDSVAGRQRIFINGVQDSNTNNWTGTLQSNPCNFYIGGDVATGSCGVIPERNFRGNIDEVKLYNKELSAAEVQADMNLGRSCSGTYDHIRIEHDGQASICTPEAVVVKACLNANCSTLYTGAVTVQLSPAGWVGGNTFTFSGGIGSRQLSVGSAGNVTLGTVTAQPIPVGAARCFNGSTETCTMNYANASCTFDAVEPSAAPQTRLFTKLSGTAFGVDVLALSNGTTINTGYTGSVDVDLVDASAGNCPIGAGLNTATTLSFVSGNAGRKNLSFTYSGAAPNVRVRMKQGASAPACSTDNFAIRPSAAQIVTTASATAPSTTATPAFKAGANFALSATTVPASYAGTWVYDNSKLTAQITDQAATVASGGVIGTLTPVSLVANAAAVNATYSEVGYAYLAPGAFMDNTFAAVDRTNGDCITSTIGGANLSDTLSGGKYGCDIGNRSTVSLGRFYPNRFVISAPTSTPFCGTAPTNDFTYFGQDGFLTNFTLTAQNTANATTQNYRGAYAKFIPTSYGAYGFITAAALPSGSALAASATDPTGNWVDGVATVVARHQVSRPTAPTGETLITVNAAPTDGEASASSTAVATNVRLRYGRLRMQNAYGSELLDLPVPFEAQYWTGSFYATNTWDNCTVLPMSSLVMSNFTGGLAACETQITPTGNQTLSGGKISSGLKLTKPGATNSGSVYLAFNVSSTATGNTCLSTTSTAATAANKPWFGPNIGGRATFGIYRSPLIYLRENY
jgi:uncharacterized repeat protein (TIGR01451 family)